MSDLQRVVSWFGDGQLLRPGRGPNTVHLARAIASVASAPAAIDEHVRDIAGRIGAAEHLVFVLADGFGMNLMEHLPAESILRGRCAMRIDAVFPSSTAPALTSFATGQFPARHGLLFWYQYLNGAGISITTLPFIERFTRKPLEHLEIHTATMVSQPPQVTEFPRNVLSVQPAGTSDSAYTRYYTAGTPVYGYESLEDAVDAISHRVLKALQPTYTYFYFSEIDRHEHDYGPHSDEAMAVLLRFETEIATLAEALSGRARIVISADHGQFRVEDSSIRYIEEDDELIELLRCVPTGEGPAPAFHVRPGREKDFEASFRRRFGDEYALLTAAEVQEMKLLGPDRLGERARAVLGDYLAVTADPVVLRYRPASGPMPGDHGGLSRDEMEVPLIII